MLNTLAVSGYRSLFDIVLPFTQLTVITGANGSGKSNLYKALNLLSEAADGNVIGAMAREGGLPSTLWAGPGKPIKPGQPLQGQAKSGPAAVKLGFAGDEFSYSIELGMPVPTESAFNLDPVIKRESVWHGASYRPASALVDRAASVVKRRAKRQWQVVSAHTPPEDSLFAYAGDPATVPEVFALQATMRRWRFYADFRTDADAPARQSRPATRTPVLQHDGSDLAAALQTIVEVGDVDALEVAIDDAFPESTLVIDSPAPGQLTLGLQQPGLLRPLSLTEWSDGMLQYILLAAALLSPRPPALLVLNEPETSLHPDLLPALSRLITTAATRSQVWVISHAQRLVNALEESEMSSTLMLEKSAGRTELLGYRPLDLPAWRWPAR